MDQILANLRIDQVNGILLDLGVSSHQLTAESADFPTMSMHRWICA